MQEGAPRQDAGPEKKKRASFTEVALLGVGLLTAHPEAKALDMPPYTPWHIGVEDNLREAVERDKVEYATVYTYFTDRSGAWVSLTRGEFGRVRNDVGADFIKVISETRGREIAAVCHVHTHQAEIFKEDFKDKPRPQYHPPSTEDIGYAYSLTYQYAKKGFPREKVRFAVADEKGLWYFAPSKNPETMDVKARVQAIFPSFEQRKAFSEELYPFITNSAKPGFKIAKEMPALKRTYANVLGATVRHVAWKDIDKEPPCAGADYKPQL